MRNLDSVLTGICTPDQCLYDSNCPDVGDTCFGTGGIKGKFRIIICRFVDRKLFWVCSKCFGLVLL